MTTQTDGEAVLKEMVEGLEGVTPGPWDWLMSGLIRALRDDLAVPLFEVQVPHKKYQRLTKTYVQEVSNGQHIARCSPDNIRAIAAYVDHLQSALKESIRLQGEYAAEVERLKAERDAIRSETLEEVAAFCDKHQVGVNPRSGYKIDEFCAPEGTHPGMAYAEAFRAMKEPTP